MNQRLSIWRRDLVPERYRWVANIGNLLLWVFAVFYVGWIVYAWITDPSKRTLGSLLEFLLFAAFVWAAFPLEGHTFGWQRPKRN